MEELLPAMAEEDQPNLLKGKKTGPSSYQRPINIKKESIVNKLI